MTRRPTRRPLAATARSVAVDALMRVERGAYSNLALPRMLRGSGLSDRDRAFATDLVYGTLRQQGRVDFLLERVADRNLAELDPPVRAALRMGVYQLLSGTPAHAAVSASVGVLVGPFLPARSFANAVLRRIAALGPPWPWPEGDGDEALAVRTSHPSWIVARLRRDLGDAAALATLEADNLPPAVTLRPNRLRTTPDDLAAELSTAGVEVERGRLVPETLVVRGIGDPAELPAVAEGRASPQDQASQAVAAAVAAGPGEDILDVAAAPGGKATALAEAMGDTGRVVAGDLRAGRAGQVVAAARRLGLRSVLTVVADGRHLPFPGDRFDRVLVDAPCSGLGVLRRRPEARWRIGSADVDRAAALQRELLAAAVAAARPGGLVAYGVCTLTREETLDIDTWAAGAFPDVTAVDPPGPPWRRHGRGALLLPADAGTDGMYLLLLHRP